MRTRTVRTIVNKWTRGLHRWGAIVALVPVAVVIATGIILQLKKELDWIQPPSARGVAALGEGDADALDLSGILERARTVEEAGIESWADVDRLDVRPGKGMVKVRASSKWEVQIDLHTGEVLQTEYRRSDLIESIHDGSYFAGDITKLYVFLPTGVILFGLWLTGAYLWVLPIWSKRRGRIRRARRAAES